MTQPDPVPRRLVAAGLDLLADGDLSGLTLRKAALKAGVSHAAPAHFFGGLPGLSAAIATEAFREFTGTMVRHRDVAPDTPRARLAAICDGYLDFASRRRGLFDLMFVAPGVDRHDAALEAAGAEAYAVLRDACRPFAAGPDPDEVFEAAVWSLVHGYALLSKGTPRPPFAALLARLVPEA
jgi:AcrR family transcriptional regulator